MWCPSCDLFNSETWLTLFHVSLDRMVSVMFGGASGNALVSMNHTIEVDPSPTRSVARSISRPPDRSLDCSITRSVDRSLGRWPCKVGVHESKPSFRCERLASMACLTSWATLPRKQHHPSRMKMLLNSLVFLGWANLTRIIFLVRLGVVPFLGWARHGVPKRWSELWVDRTEGDVRMIIGAQRAEVHCSRVPSYMNLLAVNQGGKDGFHELVLLAWELFLRVQSEAQPVENSVPNEAKSSLLAASRRSAIWANWKDGSLHSGLAKRKNRPKGSWLVRPCICKAGRNVLAGPQFCVLVYRLAVSTRQLRLGYLLARPFLQLEGACSIGSSFNRRTYWLKAFIRDRACKEWCNLGHIFQVGEWGSAAFLRYAAKDQVEIEKAFEEVLTSKEGEQISAWRSVHVWQRCGQQRRGWSADLFLALRLLVPNILPLPGILSYKTCERAGEFGGTSWSRIWKRWLC